MRGGIPAGWLVVFVLGMILGTVLVRGCAPQDPEPIPAPPSRSASGPAEPAAEMVAEDIELVQGTGGRIDWRIRARVARYDQDRELVSIVRPEVFAYIGEERDEVFVRADTGEVNRKADNFRLTDNVVGRYGLFALKADELEYIGAMGKVFLKGQVIVHRPDVDVRATAIEIDVATREMVAAGGVVATLSRDAVDGEHMRRLDLGREDKE